MPSSLDINFWTIIFCLHLSEKISLTYLKINVVVLVPNCDLKFVTMFVHAREKSASTITFPPSADIKDPCSKEVVDLFVICFRIEFR